MKGLILKDILLLKSQMKNLIFIIFGLSVFFLIQGEYNFVISIIPVYLLMLYITTFSYDDFNHFDTFANTLPYARKDIIKSKYILLICGTVFSSILLPIIIFILHLFNNSINLNEVLSSSIGIIFGITIVAAIFTPFIYKFGIQKGRMAIFGLLVAITLILGYIIKTFKIDYSFIINYINDMNVWILLLGLFVILIIVLYITYKISCVIYTKKEF